MAVLYHHNILVDRVLRDQQILLNKTTSSSNLKPWPPGHY